ncbi:HlyD family efflux transporter periplasmic adaptor subunit [Suttonella sp. R2A3]|uniref:HlyD family secretion protein n=1 Tax=Suttonella sp. R2A3 TaxID=2908648 RepID=UPI001F2224E5|nr:HlyD family efflux transporter periplasmic adaptor subunit [Suttonella sp. R2A3]UJF24436.1 HlyD family efflux transporter periplasmic adaptor subunit [Suttonella sp. R2A3]
MSRWLLIFTTLCVLLGCEQQKDDGRFNGYIEGDYRIIISPQSGRLERLLAVEGETLSDGVIVAQLDDTNQQLALEMARAQYETSRAQWRNLQSGRRPPELATIRAQRRAIEAELAQAKTDAERYRRLADAQAVSRAQAETAESRVQALSAQIAALDAQLDSAELPARSEQIDAANAQMQATAVAVKQAEEALADRQIISQFSGRVEAVYRHPGEYVRDGEALLKVLPEDARKVVFYLPQKSLPDIRVGQEINVTSDGAPPQRARISLISDQATFTPPVIYSNTTRNKLVFRVAARLNDATLPPGLPVSVSYE